MQNGNFRVKSNGKADREGRNESVPCGLEELSCYCFKAIRDFTIDSFMKSNTFKRTFYRVTWEPVSCCLLLVSLLKWFAGK